MAKSSDCLQLSTDSHQPTENNYKCPQFIEDCYIDQVITNNSTSEKKEDNTALDGGWGWLVMCATFYLMFMASIPTLCFGILFSRFLTELNVTSTITAWIFNLAFINAGICTFLIGPLVGEFGWRGVGLATTTMFSAGFILSAFATSPYFLMFSFSVLVGCNTDCLMNLAYIMIPNYFLRLRNIANSITTSGLCLGHIVMPLVITYLQEEYSFRGAALLTGALCLNGCVAAMVLHPVQWHTQKPSVKKENSVADSYPVEQNRKTSVVVKANSNMQEDTNKDDQFVECQRKKNTDSVMQEDSEVGHHLVEYCKMKSIIVSNNSTEGEHCRVNHYDCKGQKQKNYDKKEYFTHIENPVMPYHPKSTDRKTNFMTKGVDAALFSNSTGWHTKKYSLQDAKHFDGDFAPLALDSDVLSKANSINYQAKCSEINGVKMLELSRGKGMFWQTQDLILKKDKVATQHRNELVNQSSVHINKDTTKGSLERGSKRMSVINSKVKTEDKTMNQAGGKIVTQPVTQKKYYTFPQTKPTKPTPIVRKPLQQLGRASVTVIPRLHDIKINIRLTQILLGLAECIERISTMAVHNLAHLKSPIIVVLSLVVAIPTVVMFNVCALVPFAMKANGFTQLEASFCLSVAGGCNLFSRLITGTLTWCHQVKIRTVFLAGTCLLFVCIMGFIIPSGGLELKVVMLGLGTVGYGLIMSLCNLLFIEELGIDLMLPCMCITGLACSILHFVLGLLVGLIRDISGSYDGSLGFCAACMFLSLILGFNIPHAHRLATKWEQEKGKNEEEEYARGRGE